MPFKDKERNREYQREYQRLRRAGKPTRAVIKPASKILNPEQTITAQRLLRVLGHLIGQMLKTQEGDIFMRSRTAGYLISIGLKAVEVADLEARLTNLENKVLGGKK